MKNKKGFTLIELLAVILVIGLIMLIAVPNIVGLSSGVKKDQMLDDAKKLISLAKYRVNTDYDLRHFSKQGVCSNNSCTLSFDFLNVDGELGEDPDGGTYEGSSYVIYRKNSNTIEYCVRLIGSKRTIGNTTCVLEGDLYSRSNVQDR